MANDRMYIRCKGCGDLHFLAKCYDDGYFTTHEGEELRQGLDDFFDRHKWCYRDKYYGGFELVYESDDWLEKQKEQKPVSISCGHENDAEWGQEDKEKIVTISEIIEHCTTIPYSGGTLTLNKEYKKELLCFIRTLRPSWKPSEMNTNCEGCLYWTGKCKLPKGLDCLGKNEAKK